MPTHALTSLKGAIARVSQERNTTRKSLQYLNTARRPQACFTATHQHAKDASFYFHRTLPDLWIVHWFFLVCVYLDKPDRA